MPSDSKVFMKSSRYRILLAGLLLIGLIVTAYLPALEAGFNWDDDDHLTNNPCIVGPLGLKEIWTTKAARICPLVLTSFWGQHALWGLHPLPYHLVNILMHAAAAVVMWRALSCLNVRSAWFGAALWGLHPVQVESVAWITELKNTQSGLFFILAVWFFVKSKTADRNQDRSSANRYYILTLLCGALAMASKSSTVVLPVVLALCAWWMDRRWRLHDLVRIAPLVLLSGVAGVVSMWTQKLEGASGPEWMGSWSERTIVAGKAIWFYLGKLLWPDPLIFIYPRWQIDASRFVSYLPALGVIVVLLVLWSNRNHRWARAGFFAFTYFIVALFPVLGFLNHYFLRYSFVGDHFQYLASMGPLALAASATMRGFDRFGKRQSLRPAVGGTLLLILGILTWRQTAIYYSPETLWRATIEKNSDCWMAQSNLAGLLLEKGDVDEAIAHFEKAVEIWPGHAEAHNNLGNALLQKGRADEALVHFQKVLEHWPNEAEAHNNIGGILLQQGKIDEAIAQFEKVLSENPAHAKAHNNLGNALLRKGEVDEAIVQYEKTLDLPFDHAESHYNLGNALMGKGDVDGAIAHYREALALRPAHASAHNNLGNALQRKGLLAEAVFQYRKATESEPGSLLFQNNLAWMLATCADKSLRDGAAAVRLAEHANQVSSASNPIILRTLAAAYAENGRFGDATDTARLALNRANADGNAGLAQSLEREIALYDAGSSYHD